MIWILGAGGYIGSHLLAAFASDREPFVGVDKDVRAILPLQGRYCTISQMDLAEEVPHFKHGDVVYHLATMKHFPAEFNPERARRDIYESTIRVVEKCQRENAFLVFSSSRTVYGSARGYISEDYPLTPSTVYGKLKKECEEIIREGIKRYVIIRLSSVYGGYRPYDPYMAVADKFMYSALNKEPLIVEGGTQVFDFTFLDEVVNNLKRLISIPKWNYTVHFTSGKPIDVGSLAHIVKGITNSSATIKFVAPRKWEENPPFFIGDPRKCEYLLGLKFEIPLWQGLQVMYKRYRKHCKKRQNYHRYLLEFAIQVGKMFQSEKSRLLLMMKKS